MHKAARNFMPRRRVEFEAQVEKGHARAGGEGRPVNTHQLVLGVFVTQISGVDDGIPAVTEASASAADELRIVLRQLA